MSDSVSTHTPTKTGTHSTTSDSTDVPVKVDRWTNNISYRQLVVSSCIGVFQLWWHPYLHDLRKLLPFIFLYNVFSVFVGYPMFFLELVIGAVTKKGVLSAWDLAPVARGVGCSMLLTSAVTALALGVVAAWWLALAVHSAHSFLPWLHCAAAAQPPCAARHRPLTNDSETPANSFFFNFVLNLKRDDLEGGMGKIVWELYAYYVICWLLIYFIAVKKIYSYSKLVLFKDVLAFFVLICCAIGCTRLEGAGRMFRECDWSVLFDGFQIWREAIEYALLEMTVSQGTLVMLGSYCPQQKVKMSQTALLSFVASKTCCMLTALTLGATHGALMTDYDSNGTNIWSGMRDDRPGILWSACPGDRDHVDNSHWEYSPITLGPPASVILWADYVARVPGSQFWSGLIFFTLFVLTVSFVSLTVQTIMSTFSGRSIRKITWAFLIIICSLFCTIGVITLCTQSGLYILTFLMDWPVTRPRTAIAAVMGFVITFAYGQTTFCEDIFFAVGEYPCVFIRICWAIAPFFLMTAFFSGLTDQTQSAATAGWSVVGFMLLPIFAVLAAYLIFKCRVRNIVRSEK
ncbi:sodium-dependent proline transporter-like isoform X2 [Choristoneura fumiferana]|uniref:sodium-dependent proline transporter-like isoform X2 n=1 Tax=Choristoneura fumiferana TaxID=7141 RepID=UPI003D15D0FA